MVSRFLSANGEILSFIYPQKRLVFKNLTRFIGSVTSNQRQITSGFDT